MPKPVWCLIASFIVVPGSVWAESLDQTQQPTGDVQTRRTAVSHDDGHGLEGEGSMSIQIPKLNVRVFLDVGFNVTSADDRRESSFTMGQLDLLVTSELNDKAYFLAEAFFSNPDNNSQAFMLARAIIRYSISGLVNLRIGQMHTSIGYWNSFYHHGSFIQTTVSRPEILRNDRAYLPIHAVGVELFGALEGRAVDVGYTLGVFNGRGIVPPAVVRVKDDNDAKGIAALINLSLHAVDGLTVGATLYHDTIPPNPSLTTRTKSIGERIIGGHLVYKTNRVELLGELFNISHDDHTSDQGYDTAGWYAQGSYVVGSLTPYYRFDFLNFGGVDPYFAPDVNDVHKHTLGVRWDLLPWNALKVEYGFANYEALDDEHLLSINLSLAF